MTTASPHLDLLYGIRDRTLFSVEKRGLSGLYRLQFRTADGRLFSADGPDLEAMAADIYAAAVAHTQLVAANAAELELCETELSAFARERGCVCTIAITDLDCRETSPPQYSARGVLTIGKLEISEEFCHWDEAAMRRALVIKAHQRLCATTE